MNSKVKIHTFAYLFIFKLPNINVSGLRDNSWVGAYILYRSEGKASFQIYLYIIHFNLEYLPKKLAEA